MKPKPSGLRCRRPPLQSCAWHLRHRQGQVFIPLFPPAFSISSLEMNDPRVCSSLKTSLPLYSEPLIGLCLDRAQHFVDPGLVFAPNFTAFLPKIQQDNFLPSRWSPCGLNHDCSIVLVQRCPIEHKGGPQSCSFIETLSTLKLSRNQVDYTNSLIFLVKNMLCSTLHCQIFLIWLDLPHGGPCMPRNSQVLGVDVSKVAPNKDLKLIARRQVDF